MAGPGMAEGVLAYARDDLEAPSARARDVATAFREHVGFVFRVLRRMGVAEASLDDGVQEVFIVAHRRRDDYDTAVPIRSWLYGIARRIAAHHHRAAARAQRKRGELPAPPAAPSPEAHVEQSLAAEFVQAFIDGLAASHRGVFVLSEVEELSAPEIGAALGLKLNTVYSRLRAARSKFARAVARRQAQERRRDG